MENELKEKEIVFVTHNLGKLASAQKYLKHTKLVSCDVELDEPRTDDLTEIAKSKVIQAYNIVKRPCIAQDSGFYIDALNGFPRTFVNFSMDTIGVDGFLKLMDGIENRKCAFKECLAYFDGKEIKYFYGLHEGTIAKEKSGISRKEKWSDLWYIFKPKNFDVTLAEMDEIQREERRKIDGSVSAIDLFAKWYEGENSEMDRMKEYSEDIDILKAEIAFKEYMKNYDLTDPKIALKVTHTYEVLNAAKYIAKNLNLSKEDYDLASLIALLHDIGRFEQLKEYDSYDDTIGLNHAEFGIKLLFENNKIRDFIETDKYDEIIYKAILNHNKYKLDVSGFTDKEIMHSKIIRDADKLDNFRVKEKESFVALFKEGEDEETIGKLDITDVIYNTFEKHCLIKSSDRVTYMDHWVSFIAFIFDMNFDSSLKYIKENNYIDILVDRVKYSNEDTKEKMENIRNISKEYIDRRLMNV